MAWLLQRKWKKYCIFSGLKWDLPTFDFKKELKVNFESFEVVNSQIGEFGLT